MDRHGLIFSGLSVRQDRQEFATHANAVNFQVAKHRRGPLTGNNEMPVHVTDRSGLLTLFRAFLRFLNFEPLGVFRGIFWPKEYAAHIFVWFPLLVTDDSPTLGITARERGIDLGSGK
jgi:hypothetical protein